MRLYAKQDIEQDIHPIEKLGDNAGQFAMVRFNSLKFGSVLWD